MKEEDIKPPKKDLSNHIHEYINDCAKTLTGGFINPLIDLALPSFHQKRFERWCENIYDAIIEIEKNKISRENLIADEEFISLLKESVSIASKTHQDEKHQLLKNALLNSFDSNLTFDSKLIFTRLIDSLTISHCEILSTLYAVWNNRIKRNQSTEKHFLKKDFFEWSNRKKKVFTESEVDKSIEWMKRKNIVPTGWGDFVEEIA